MHASSQSAGVYDVVVVGGALAGAATAVMLLRKQPGLRVLVVEKSPEFTRRVGEATVEISTYFLTRVLGLTRHLNQRHLTKQGLRFWFSNEESRTVPECSEIGGRYLARVPAFLVDRAVLDQEVLDCAVRLGAELERPAVVEGITLQEGGTQRLTLRVNGKTASIDTRWVVDASGIGAKLARQHGWIKPNRAHPTSSAWARWKGVKDLDGAELADKYPEWAAECYGTRSTATNHLMGPGWWAWIIPLKGDEVSVGVVFDQRLVQWPDSGSVGERLKAFLRQHPVGNELLAEAECVEGDVHWRKDLSYVATTLAGDGFVLVGDAAGFLDPFYSPGMDWVTFTTVRATSLILAQQRGEAMAPLVARHNRDFTRSYQRWFEALYLDKYEYFGEYDLMRLAFLVDLGSYYLGVASQPYKRGERALLEPVFSTPPSVPVYLMMKFFNRRLARIARCRRERGLAGRRNHGRRFMFGGFTFQLSSGLPILKALGCWGWIELTEGWRSWFKGARRHEAVVDPAKVEPSVPLGAA